MNFIYNFQFVSVPVIPGGQPEQHVRPGVCADWAWQRRVNLAPLLLDVVGIVDELHDILRDHGISVGCVRIWYAIPSCHRCRSGSTSGLLLIGPLLARDWLSRCDWSTSHRTLIHNLIWSKYIYFCLRVLLYMSGTAPRNTVCPPCSFSLTGCLLGG